MAKFGSGTLVAHRNDPFQQVLLFNVDMRGTNPSFAVGLSAGAGGAPIMLLTVGSGITILEPTIVADGTVWCVVVLSLDKATWQAKAAPYLPAEPGARAKLAWDLQWTPPADLIDPVPPVETTLADGSLIILESVNA